jgi:hypothetical protein
VRSYDGHEIELPSWTAAQAEDWLGRWAMNLMLITYRHASSSALYGFLRVIYRPLPATAPRNRRHRAGS